MLQSAADANALRHFSSDLHFSLVDKFQIFSSKWRFDLLNELKPLSAEGVTACLGDGVWRGC